MSHVLESKMRVNPSIPLKMHTLHTFNMEKVGSHSLSLLSIKEKKTVKFNFAGFLHSNRLDTVE